MIACMVGIFENMIYEGLEKLIFWCYMMILILGFMEKYIKFRLSENERMGVLEL